MRAWPLILSVLGLHVLGCEQGQRLTVTNRDSIELVVHVVTSDGALNWTATIAPGASVSTRLHPTGDVTFDATVMSQNSNVRARTIGYTSASWAQLDTCLDVSRSAIHEDPC